MPAAKDITGMRFGKLVAIEWTGRSTKNGGRVWKCLCDCGNETTVTVSVLTSKNTTSCGCAQLASAKTHGLSSTPEWNSWRAAKDRCLNPNNKDYPKYGAIGITFSSEWGEDFSAFLAHVGFKPKDGKRYTLGRIDNTKGYTPGNVRWETDATQCRNRSLSSRNKTGVCGISEYKTTKYGKVYHYIVASWQTSTSKQQTAYFSVNKLGYEEAFKHAIAKRNSEMLLAENNGIVFAESHGKLKQEVVMNGS